jgi:hypothetical protein
MNSTSCLKELQIDLENLDREQISKTPRKRKRKDSKQTNLKCSKKVLEFIDNEAEEVSGKFGFFFVFLIILILLN